MNKKRPRKRSISPPSHRGSRARAGGLTLKSYTIGALPLVNRILERMQLEQFLDEYLPRDGARMAVPTSRGLMLLVRNILLSREPIYGLGEWAERYAPEQLGLQATEVERLNDDRIGRCLDRLFQADIPALVLAVVRQVVEQFEISLDELHNDSTTVSFYGAYENAAEEQPRGNRTRLAITYGHSKDHRPDLKQLLYVLTITEDGGVPVYFTAASGNTVDDTTHRDTWCLLRELVGRPDFLYVADCKLASRDNLQFIHNQSGRFITLMPRTRREDQEFRQRVVLDLESVNWEAVAEIPNGRQEVIDRIRVCSEPLKTAEGFRLLWYHSTRKAKRDAQARVRAIERAAQELADLQDRLRAPKTRFRDRDRVQAAVDDILERQSAGPWLHVQIEEELKETFKQATRGRPGKNTRYVREVHKRYRLSWTVNETLVKQEEAIDGLFPLITNQWEMTAEEVWRAYKRQPLIEKRFSQFKTDFEVAPVYLKEVTRIQALMAVYFFVLMAQTLLERELRLALDGSDYDALPLYPEGRSCQAPTTRRIIDVFETVQRHQLTGGGARQLFVTDLTPLQRQIARWFGISPGDYGR